MFERVAYATDLGVIAMITALLEGENIKVPDLFRSAHVSIAGVDHGFYVTVGRSDAQRAREVLAASEFSRCIVASARK